MNSSRFRWSLPAVLAATWMWLVAAATAAIPTVTTVSPIPGLPASTPNTLSFETLKAASNAADSDGDTISFQISTITTGTLTKNGTPVVAGTTTLASGESVVWTPVASVTGLLNAFVVKAVANGDVSTTSAQVRFIVPGPVFTTLSNITGQPEDFDTTISYTTLDAASNATDPDGDPISYRVESVSPGSSLLKNGVPVVPGTTLLSSGQSLIWSPPANENGLLNAFTVKAVAGGRVSATAVQVKILVAAVDDRPVISGTSVTAVDDNATATALFPGVTISDADDGRPDPETVVMKVRFLKTAGELGVFFMADAVRTEVGSEYVYTFPAKSPSAATTAIRTATFDPAANLVAGGLTQGFTLRLEVADSDSLNANPQLNGTVTITGIEDPPSLVLSMNTASIPDFGVFRPFRLSVSDPDPGDNETKVVTLTLVEVGGPLGTLTGGTITGNRAQLESLIQNVSYAPNSAQGTVTAQFSISGGGATASTASLALSNQNDSPDISGVTTSLIFTTDDPAAPVVHPFSSVTISDPDYASPGVRQPLTATVTLDDPARGSVSPVTLTGDATSLTTQLRLLVFTPTPNRVVVGNSETTTLTLTVSDGTASRTNSQTKVATLSVNGAPAIIGIPALAAQPVAFSPPAPLAPVLPFSGLSVSDDDAIPQVTVTIKLDNPAKGSLATLGGFSEVTPGSKIYRMTGLADVLNGTTSPVTLALRGLSFIPSTTFSFPPNQPGYTTFTIEVADSLQNRTTKTLAIVLRNVARNWLVTRTLDDTAVGSLRYAVQNALDNDVITFALPAYPAVIRLNNPLGTLVLNHHLRIKGPGADMLTITGDKDGNGTPDVQLFVVQATVEMEGLTLAKGRANVGGAIHVGRNPLLPSNDPGSLKMSHCALVDCFANQWGGALDVEEGAVSLNQCLLKNNSTDLSSGLGGGAVSLYTSQACSFVGTTFSGNRQRATSGYGGGGIYAENFNPQILCPIEVTHCTFSQNEDGSNQGTSIASNVFGTSVNTRGTIFADSAQRNLFVTGSGQILSSGRNLSNDETRTTLLQGGVPQSVRLLNQSGSLADKVSVDPQLLPLTKGIGDLEAYPLNPASPAIGSAVVSEGVDQRGVLRDTMPDSGAVEHAQSGRVVINEIFASPTGNQFIEFFVPRNSTAINFLNFQVWVDGTLRHTFAADTIQPGFGILLADNNSLNANGSLVVTPAAPLTLPLRGTIQLRSPDSQIVQSVSYVDVFVDPFAPTSSLDFNPDNSLSLVPQFSGSAFVPSSLAKSPPLEGVDVTSLSIAPPNGSHANTSPGKDNGNTAFGAANANPLAVADQYLLNEDSLASLNVLSNDLEADGLDQLFIVDVSSATSGIPPVGNDASIVTTLGATVQIQPGNSPLRGTSIGYDPRSAHNHLSAGAHAFDSFYYTILDFGPVNLSSGVIASYATSGPATIVASPAHGLNTNDAIRITGANTSVYNNTFRVSVLDANSFIIPVVFAGDPGVGLRGTWAGTLPSEQLVTVDILGANDAPTPTDNTVATKEDTILRIFGDNDLIASSITFDTDASYPLPKQFSTVPLLADDTDPDDDDNPAVTGTFKRLKLVGVGQAYPVANFSGTVGVSPVTVTAPAHGLTTGSTILLSGYAGHPSYNGYKVATVVDANTFTIPVAYVDNAATKGLWGILNNDTRLSTTSVRGAEVKLEIRADRAQTNIVYNPRTSSYLDGLAKDEVDNTDSFYYAVEDSHAAVSFAKVTISVTGVNDSPVPGNDPSDIAQVGLLPGVTNLHTAFASGTVLYQLPAASGTAGRKDAAFSYEGNTVLLRDLAATNEDSQIPILSSVVLSNDSDVDRTNVLSVQIGAGQSVSREGAAISLSGDGLTLTYNPLTSARLSALAREETVIDTFNVTIYDGVIGIPSVVAVLVTGVNDQPVASADTVTIPEDQLLTLGSPGVLLNDSDADQDTSLPDNKKMLLPVAGAGSTVFGTLINSFITPAAGSISQLASISGVPSKTLVIATAHGLQTGEEIVIFGSGSPRYNGQFPIIKVDDNSFSIPVTFDAASASLAPGSWTTSKSTLTYDPRGSIFNFTGPGPSYTLDGLAQGQTYTDTYIYTMLDGSAVFANDDLYRIEADRSSIELKVLTNDVNLNTTGGALRIVSAGVPNHGGTLTFNGTTSLIYTPETGFVGDEVFTYTVEDEVGNRDSALVTARVTVMQLNGNLQANADAFTVAVGQAPLLNVLANDDLLPASSATLSITRIASPATHGGSVAIEGTRIRYTPAGGGAPYRETFSYEISAGGTARAIASVTIDVVDRTNTLNVRDDYFSVPSGSANNNLNVLENDNILPGSGDALTITGTSVPDFGSVSIASGGLGLRYSPPSGFAGTAHFTYTTSDGLGGTGTAQVSVNVGFLTTNPDFFTVLYDDPAKTTDNGSTSLNVLGNDAVLQGPGVNLTIVAVTPINPALGVMSIEAGGGALGFNPAESQAGQQIFTYTVQDSSGHQATGSLTVVVLQQGLGAGSDSFTVKTDSADNELLVLANDVLFTPGGGNLSIQSIGTGPNAPNHGGTVTITALGDRLIYTPAAGFDGVESFTYVVTDGFVTSTARVEVRSTSGALAAGTDFYTVFRGSVGNLLPVLVNDLVIPDGGQILTITATTNDPANIGNPVNRGTLAIGADLSSLIYTPNALNTVYPYTETFTYEISDGSARRASAVLTIQVQDRLGARDIDTNDDVFTVQANSAPVALEVLANDNVLPGSADSWILTSVTAPTANLYSPFISADLVDVPALVQKLVGHSDPVSLLLWNGFAPATQSLLLANADAVQIQNALVAELNVVVAGPSIYSVPRFTGITLRTQTSDLLQTNPTGEQGIVLNRLLLEDAYSTELRKTPGGGVVQISGNVLFYTPQPGFTGAERFTYRVSDGLGGTGSGEVIVRVGDISVSADHFAVLGDSTGNDLDVLANDGILRDAFPDTPLPSAADFTLATQQPISISPSAAAGTANVVAGKVRFTPRAGFFGIATLTYWASDDSGGLFPGTATVEVQKRGSDRSSATLSIIVTGVNDPPVMLGSVTTALNDNATTHPFAGVTIRDVDNQLGEIVTVRISFPASHGSLSGAFNLISPGVYEFIGTGAQATAAIRTLVYTPVENRIIVAGSEPTIFTVSLQDPFVSSPVIVTDAQVAVTAVNNAPIITGTQAGQRVYWHSSINPFEGVDITDVDDLGLQALTVGVTIDNVIKGNFTNLGGFVQGVPGSYSFTGTPAQVAAALRGLTFNPTPGTRVTPGTTETANFTIVVNDGFAPALTDAITSVIVQHPLMKKLLPRTLAGADASQAGAQFGSDVDISGDTVVVGSVLRDATVIRPGAAYIYERNAGGAENWGQVAVLAPTDLRTRDGFGGAVTIDGDTIAVSAELQTVSGPNGTGVVYVFQRDALNRNQWNQVAKLALPSSDRSTTSLFGKTLDVFGSTLIVGAPYGNNFSQNAGAAYVFEKDQGGLNQWGLQQKLLPSETVVGVTSPDSFSQSVAIHGNTIAVAASGLNFPSDTPLAKFGAVYLFERASVGALFTQTKKVQVDTVPGASSTDLFGSSVDLSDTTLVVGASRYDRTVSSTVHPNTGAAYVFERSLGGAGNWGLAKTLLNPTAADEDRLGNSVAIDGDLVVVGAPRLVLTNPTAVAGYVNVYRRNEGGAGNWGLLDVQQPSASNQNDLFGLHCAMDGFTAIVGARLDKLNATNALDAGAGYVYEFKFNNAPSLVRPIADQTAGTTVAFAFTVPDDTFSDVDFADVLTYRATLADGSPLSRSMWLQFNPATRSFAGTPLAGDDHPIDLIVIATDEQGHSVSSNVFTVSVTVSAARAFELALEEWQKANFAAAALADSGQQASLWGGSADPDGDGYSNSIEMALGLNPNAADGPGIIAVEANPPLITIVYPLDNDCPAEFVHVEWSLDLITWRQINVSTVVRTQLAGSRIMASSAFPPTPSGMIYMRLKVGP